ncbi:MAG: tagaturonate epimerase family protein [Candidatus Hermodarchaeota archaeon]
MRQTSLVLPKYSIGVGDRFGHQCEAQLQAITRAINEGINVIPVWNKSDREHLFIGTSPEHTRKAADRAVHALKWDKPYFVDADHINLKNVNKFIKCSDFFTIDVAEFIGIEPSKAKLEHFLEKNKKYSGSLKIPGITKAYTITDESLGQIGLKFLNAVNEAGKIYRHIESVKGTGKFITEVSMDESDRAQTPVELFFILSMIADEWIPLQTIAPKFTGQFNKGIDYLGNVKKFTQEFEENLAVLRYAVKKLGLPSNLKLSIHSGSDKFSLYPVIRSGLKKFKTGVHLKTAGTTWLEEIIGLAMGEGEGLVIAKEIYKQAYARFDELCTPYAAVVNIDKDKLPLPKDVGRWDGDTFVKVLQHNQSCELFNLHFRQLLHVAYKIAAEMGKRYLNALENYKDKISVNVTENLYARHIKPLFGG